MSTSSCRGPTARGRSAFTLLELLVAIVLTSVIALLVYSVVDAGVRTQERLSDAARSMQVMRIMRATLEDGLRNARLSPRPGEPAFAVDDRENARGHPADRLRFSTVGTLPPLTPDAEWIVTVEPTAAGLTLAAVPTGVRAPRSFIVGPLPGITGLSVRVLQQRSDSASGEWLPGGSGVPRAVEISYWSDAGPVGTPLRVAFPLGGGFAR